MKFSLLLSMCMFCLLPNVLANANVPFPSSLIGKTITRFVSGTRFSISEGVRITESKIIHIPQILTFIVPPTLYCDGTFELKIDRDTRKVSITEFPTIDETPSSPIPDGNFPQVCRRTQEERKKVSFPTGPTAGQFRTDLRKMFDGIDRVRVGNNPPPFPVTSPRPRLPCGDNFQVEPLLGYLRTVAFQLNFSLE